MGATLNESPSLKQEKEIDEDKEKMGKTSPRNRPYTTTAMLIAILVPH